MSIENAIRMHEKQSEIDVAIERMRLNLEAMEAWKAGKDVQCRPISGGIWSSQFYADTPAWQFESVEYRPKPEPVAPAEIWVNVYPQNCAGHPSLDAANDNAGPARLAIARYVLAEEIEVKK